MDYSNRRREFTPNSDPGCGPRAAGNRAVGLFPFGPSLLSCPEARQPPVPDPTQTPKPLVWGHGEGWAGPGDRAARHLRVARAPPRRTIKGYGHGGIEVGASAPLLARGPPTGTDRVTHTQKGANTEFQESNREGNKYTVAHHEAM